MTKAKMYREALQRYLLSKLHPYSEIRISQVIVRHVEDGLWELEHIEPQLPAETMALIEREVIVPLQGAVALVE